MFFRRLTRARTDASVTKVSRKMAPIVFTWFYLRVFPSAIPCNRIRNFRFTNSSNYAHVQTDNARRTGESDRINLASRFIW